MSRMMGSFRFSPFRGKMLLTNDAGRYAFLTPEEFRLFTENRLERDSGAYRMLEERFFCTDAPEEVYLQRAIGAVRENHAYLFSGTTLFIFVLTNRCNNRCVYCQANGSAKTADMDLKTARKAVERLRATPAERICIEFQGGEPLINFPALKETVRCAKEVLTDKDVEFSLVSNLMLMTDEIADYIAENRISVSTSLDGPRALHDRNRPHMSGSGSYEGMLRGLDMLRKRGIYAGAIETTTRYSLPHAREIVRTYAQLGFDSLFLRPLTRLGAAGRRWEEIGYSPEEFISFYREGIQELLALNRSGTQISECHASIFLGKLLDGYSANYMELRSPCGAGIGQMAFTANGDVYTCDEGRMLAEMGDASFKLGNVFENGYDEWVSGSVCKAVCAASLLETLPGCCDCVYQPYCGVCPVVNYALEGSMTPTRPGNDRCRIYKGMLDTLLGYLMEEDEAVLNVFRKWCM